MNLTKLITASLLVGTVIFTNCKKDEKDPEPTPAPAPALTNTQKLTGKNFKLTASTVDPAYNNGTTLVTNWYNQLEACVKDDLLNFNANGTFTSDEGASKCDSDDPQTTSGTWLWSTDEKILTVKVSGQTTGTSLNVVQNDGTTLKVTYEYEEDNTKYTFTDTYTKQ